MRTWIIGKATWLSGVVAGCVLLGLIWFTASEPAPEPMLPFPPEGFKLSEELLTGPRYHKTSPAPKPVMQKPMADWEYWDFWMQIEQDTQVRGRIKITGTGVFEINDYAITLENDKLVSIELAQTGRTN